MKTSLDLPDDLVREIKRRAVQDGRKLKDAVVDLLRQGLAAVSATPRRLPESGFTNPKIGLPSIKGTPGAPISKMTTEEIYALIHNTQGEEDLERLGASFRR